MRIHPSSTPVVSRSPTLSQLRHRRDVEQAPVPAPILLMTQLAMPEDARHPVSGDDGVDGDGRMRIEKELEPKGASPGKFRY